VGGKKKRTGLLGREHKGIREKRKRPLPATMGKKKNFSAASGSGGPEIKRTRGWGANRGGCYHQRRPWVKIYPREGKGMKVELV